MIYEITVPAFIKGLNNLSAILDKGAQFAETKKVDFEVLLNSRARLTNKEAPSHPDTEKTLAEFKARIKSVVDYLGTYSENDFKESANRKITTPRWKDEWLTGQEFTLNHALPNFYFHVTTSYAILRHNGVDLGKKDYLGQMPFKK
jgi:uncharacterized protein